MGRSRDLLKTGLGIIAVFTRQASEVSVSTAQFICHLSFLFFFFFNFVPFGDILFLFASQSWACILGHVLRQ